MSWLVKPGQSLFDSVKDRFKPEDLAPLDDPALSDEQKECQRIEIEYKYGLLAAQRADEAIESYHRARADAQRMETVVDRIRTQWKQAWAKVAETERTLEDVILQAERAIKDARLQAERLGTIHAEEHNAHRLACWAWSQAKTRAEESFAEYSSKAVQQGLDEAVGKAELTRALKRKKAAPASPGSMPETQRQNASVTTASRPSQTTGPIPTGPIPGYSSNTRARVSDPIRPSGSRSVDSRPSMHGERPQQATEGNDSAGRSEQNASDAAHAEGQSGEAAPQSLEPLDDRHRALAKMKQKRKQTVSSDDSELTELSDYSSSTDSMVRSVSGGKKRTRSTEPDATTTPGREEQSSPKRVCKEPDVKEESTA